MKTIFNIQSTVKWLTIFTMVMLFSCQKDETTIVPVNPNKSYFVRIKSTDWINSGVWCSAYYYLPQLTDAIVLGGTVLVLLADNPYSANPTWIAIPSSFKGDEWNWGYSKEIIVFLYSQNGSSRPVTPGETLFKVTVIPASVKVKVPSNNIESQSTSKPSVEN